MCSIQTPKPSVLIENLRNCSGEKVSLLRRNLLSALHTDYIQMMLELSKEQGFEVTYFNIGMTVLLLVFIQLMQGVQAGVSPLSVYGSQRPVIQAEQLFKSLLHLEV